MLKGQKKHTDKEQGKTKHEAPCSVNYRATQNKNNIGTTALEAYLFDMKFYGQINNAEVMASRHAGRKEKIE